MTDLQSEQAEMDAAMLTCVERHFGRPDIAANLRLQVEAGHGMARLPEIARALDVTLDELLTQFFDAIEARCGVRYEVSGVLLKARVN